MSELKTALLIELLAIAYYESHARRSPEVNLETWVMAESRVQEHYRTLARTFAEGIFNG